LRKALYNRNMLWTLTILSPMTWWFSSMELATLLCRIFTPNALAIEFFS
jgi:hypothetical protein